ncbi:MAG: phosphoribosyltransferase [Thermodesulfovibrionales bacterium]
MAAAGGERIVEDASLRGRLHVFAERRDAGRRLAELLRSRVRGDETVLAIPSGGVPVGYEIARALSLTLDLVIVRKMQIPFNPEAGFGAVDPEGVRVVNEEMLRGLGLTGEEVEEQARRALAAVRQRSLAFRGGGAAPELGGAAVIVVDDGLASGYTMLAAVGYVRRRGARGVSVAVPTASRRTAEFIAREADLLVCPNIRSGPRFAVADAYQSWHDLSDGEVLSLLRKYQSEKGG